jgi:hypothetical protein
LTARPACGVWWANPGPANAGKEANVKFIILFLLAVFVVGAILALAGRELGVLLNVALFGH